MLSKEKLRKIYYKKRKKNYFEIKSSFFNPAIKIINNSFLKKKINLAIYYPSNFEINIIKIFEKLNNNKKIRTLLPKIKLKNDMYFYQWKLFDILRMNKYGILEPCSVSKIIIPQVILLPLLIYDDYNQRIGYGKGFYDKFLNKYLKKNKKILTIGVAFSFQKYNKLPVSRYDVKLDYILTEKGIVIKK
jgi:5-formyltetrahydrofolate cyclo-ligase